MAAADVEGQIRELEEALFKRSAELSETTADAVRSEVAFYRSTELVSRAELVFSCLTNIEFVFSAISGGDPFDTSPATATGVTRARAGVPLSSVMEAYRVAFRHVWEAVIEEAKTRPDLTNELVIRVTAKMWLAQDMFTQAMAEAYRDTLTQQVLGDETERAALVEALLEGRVSEHPGLWELADLLRIPAHGPYVVVAAQAPGVGKQALPQIDAKLLSFDIFSAWRLLPDLQLGIVHVRNDEKFDKLIALLRRVATTRVGVSSRYDNLADTHDAVRFARVALNDRTAADSAVTVFDDSLLGMAAVSSPEVMNRLAATVLGRFDDMPAEERTILFETFRAWSEHGGSVNDAAAQLFCHPNTVRHRLRRIEERTDRSLSKPRDLAELCLVFEIDRRLR
jgi:hypothetical protein